MVFQKRALFFDSVFSFQQTSTIASRASFTPIRDGGNLNGGELQHSVVYETIKCGVKTAEAGV